MNEQINDATVGEIVANDFRAAAVFERFGIDFCCGGRRSLGDACRAASADPGAVVRAIEGMLAAPEPDDVTTWPLERLIEHIVMVHHSYVREMLPMISRYLTKLVDVHAARHPELVRVAFHFDQIRGEMEQHLVKEEQVLFPYIRDLERTSAGAGRSRSPFGSVENPIRMMEREHRDAADELRLIRELTSDYQAPADGCTTYQVCMEELACFERDLHRHVHLENNVLFPRAIALERRLFERV